MIVRLGAVMAILAVLALLAILALPGSVLAPAMRTTDAAGTAGGDVDRFLQVESSRPVFSVLYQYGQVIPAADGAYGPNVHAPRTAWYVESQRAGATDVFDGVVRPDEDPALVALGLKMFHFALAREAEGGAFPGSFWPFHGTALFLSEAAPALVALEASRLAGAFRAELHWEVSRMQRAAYYMVHVVGGPGGIDDATKNHRWYEAAIALGAVGVLARDATLMRWSRIYAWKGVRMQRPDGIMPEDGGHDSGYQALGMVNASRYLELNASGKLYGALYEALSRGEFWELSRIRPDGSVDQAGDTRTAGCRERDPAGQCKTVFYAPIFSALAHWGAITGKSGYTRAARLVWKRSGYGGR